MIPLTVTPDIDRAPWRDLQGRLLYPDPPMPTISRIGLLRNGTASGRATVTIAVELPDGQFVLAETTLRLWRVANAALEASPAAAEEPLDD